MIFIMANIRFGTLAVGGTSYQPTRPDMSSVAKTCAKCGKAVYMAEELLAAGKKWHKLCFKCGRCRKMLDSSTMAEHGGELYCKPCHTRNFGTSGYGYGIGAGTLSSEKRDVTDSGSSSVNAPTAKRVTAVDRDAAGYSGWSGDGKQYIPVHKDIVTNPNACGKCNKAVYMAEEILAAGKKWHKMCFKCVNCKKLLDSSTMASHDGELYCKSCHTRKFGTTGYGYGVGAGTLASEKGVSQDKGSWLPSSTSTEQRSGGSSLRFGGAPKCPRCGKSVYAAEKIVGAGKEWHKACFNCASCHKSLDSTTVTDNEGEIYCKACYGKQFGPKGVGFGLGAGTLTT